MLQSTSKSTKYKYSTCKSTGVQRVHSRVQSTCTVHKSTSRVHTHKSTSRVHIYLQYIKSTHLGCFTIYHVQVLWSMSNAITSSNYKC